MRDLDKQTPEIFNQGAEALLGHPEVQVALGENMLATFILDADMNVVAANHNLLTERGLPMLNELAPLQPGDLLGCRFADLSSFGCGNDAHCNSCELKTSILAALEADTGRATMRFCALDSKRDAPLRITTRAFTAQGARYVVVVVQDVSAEYRRHELEHIFFHDLKNIVSVLRNVDHLTQVYESDPSELKYFIQRQAILLEEEIATQQMLSHIERPEFSANQETVDMGRIASDALATVAAYPEATTKVLNLTPSITPVITRSDPVILRRILINLIKNAIEASENAAEIRVTYGYEDQWVELRVNNPERIATDDMLNIFQRYHSTKGRYRGLGCWSAKLYAEQYLDGSLTFTSSEHEGTTFILRVPVTRTGTTRAPMAVGTD